MILDNIRGYLADAGIEGGVLDLTLSNRLEWEDTHPGKHCDSPRHESLDKIYILGSGASMDNDVEVRIGNHICLCDDKVNCGPGPCEYEYATCTDHYPVFATVGTRTIDRVDSIVMGYMAHVYSGEIGEAPDFDLKFMWSRDPDTGDVLFNEFRNGIEPDFVHPDVKFHEAGIDNNAAYFEQDGYVLFPHSEAYAASRRVTIEVWIKPEEFSDPSKPVYLLDKQASTGFNYRLYIFPVDSLHGLINLQVMDDCETALIAGWNFINEPPIIAGRWHHILASYDGLHAKIIVTRVEGPGEYEILRGNPQEEYLGPNVNMCSKAGPLVIGARFADGLYMNNYTGVMDDLQIYSEVAR